MRASRRLQEARARGRWPTAVVSYPQRITAEQAEALRRRWLEQVGRKPLVVLDQGAQITWGPRGFGRKAGPRSRV